MKMSTNCNGNALPITNDDDNDGDDSSHHQCDHSRHISQCQNQPVQCMQCQQHPFGHCGQCHQKHEVHQGEQCQQNQAGESVQGQQNQAGESVQGQQNQVGESVQGQQNQVGESVQCQQNQVGECGHCQQYTVSQCDQCQQHQLDKCRQCQQHNVCQCGHCQQHRFGQNHDIASSTDYDTDHTSTVPYSPNNSASKSNIQDCATPVSIQGNNLHASTNPDDDTRISHRNYSRLKVRILLPMISALYFANRTLTSLILQYLLDRWSDEDGHNFTESASSVCKGNESDPAFVESDRIQSRVADAAVYYSWCTSGPAFLMCMLGGALVDLIGRKAGLVISQLGTTLQVAMAVCIMRFHLSPDLFYLAYAIDGVGGSFMLFLVANLSASADINDSKQSRIFGVVIVLAFAYIFMSVTNVCLGYLISEFGYVSAGISLLTPCVIAFLITVFLLPETSPLDRQDLSLNKLLRHNCQVVLLYAKDGSREKRWSLFLSLMIFFTNTINVLSLSNTDTLYQKHEPLCWDSVVVGYYLAFRGVCHGVCGILYIWISRCIGCVSDEMNAMITNLFLAGSFVLEAFVTKTWQMFLGVLFSSIAMIEVLCSLVSATAYSYVYARTVAWMPGAVYFVMAGMAIVTFLIYIPFFHFYKRENREREEHRQK